MLSFMSGRRISATLAAVILMAAPCGNAAADGPALYVAWSVDSGPMNGTWPPGTNLGDGSFEYSGSSVDPATGLTLSWDVTAGPGMFIDGSVSIWNELPGTIDVAAHITLPVGNWIPVESELSAFVALGLTTGQGGGQIDSIPTIPYVWDTVIDGRSVGPATSLFAHPFQVWHSGASSSSTTAQYGIPTPVIGPPVLDSLGYDINFQLSDNDFASVSTMAFAGSSTCLGDVDFDDQVDVVDLTALIAAWGDCSQEVPCSEDFDASGTVDVGDLLVLLGHWGPCP